MRGGPACTWMGCCEPTLPPQPPQACTAAASVVSARLQGLGAKEARSTLGLGHPLCTDLGRTGSQLERCAQASLPRVSEGVWQPWGFCGTQEGAWGAWCH